VVYLSGRWTTSRLTHVDHPLDRLKWPDGYELKVDASAIQRLDTSGAMRLHQLMVRLEEDEGRLVRFHGLPKRYKTLLSTVRDRYDAVGEPVDPPYQTFYERIGQHTLSKAEEATLLISFLGEATLSFLRAWTRPKNMRWKTTINTMEAAGVDALPIIGLLSFLLGVVIAYQGGIQLQQYGANVFIVELVSITMVRELGPLITAIIVAGRTGSSYTAEIGTMQVTEEIDALRTIGIHPMDQLVLPKVFGLMIVMPLLTLFSLSLGIFGGMVMADGVLGVELNVFFQRLPSAVGYNDFLVGIGKAPAFALIIAIVGCFQGFRVGQSADSVGRQTTVSVVQAIFLVIVADAAFSIIFSSLGV